MRNLSLLFALLTLDLSAQFNGGHEIDRDLLTGDYYVVTIGGQIWRDSGQGYQFMATAGANATQMLIANGRLYVARIDDIKVYALDPFAQETGWDTPASDWLIALAWDGANTLYCHDSEVLYSMDMTTNAIDTVFDGFPGNPGQMVYDADEDRLLILEHDVGIWGYDLQADTYTMLLSLPYHFNHDITAACGDKWLLTMEFDQGGGMLYTVPKDLSAPGDTVYWDWSIRPEGVYYDPVGDSALYVLDDTVQTYTEPCAVASGISEARGPMTPELVVMHDQLLVTWNGNVQGTATLRLMDRMGRLVKEQRTAAARLANGHRLDIGGLPSGTYVLQIRTESSAVAGSFVLAR